MIDVVSKDYLWTTVFDDIDNDKLYKTCLLVEEELRKHFGFDPTVDSGTYGCATSLYHREYNLFHFPCPELHKLYNNMSRVFPEILDNKRYYLRTWVNLFDKDKFIDWHSHWPAEQKTYHGFYCVRTEGEHPSFTEYKIPVRKNWVDTEEQYYKVDSKDSLCVIGKSENDKHRSSPWMNDGYRVTIAFDVIPMETLRPNENFTHGLLHNYIPLCVK